MKKLKWFNYRFSVLGFITRDDLYPDSGFKRLETLSSEFTDMFPRFMGLSSQVTRHINLSQRN